MKYPEIMNRLTGISCPIFGVSWNPPESERAIARRIILFLEDRRVLYNPSELEMPDHCVRSVVDIRRYLTEELQRTPENSDLEKQIKGMRNACRKFMDKINAEENGFIRNAREQGHWANWSFNYALGEMRGTLGMYIAVMATSYGIDIDGELEAIIPEAETE